MAFSDRDVELYYADSDPAYSQVDDDLEAEKERRKAKVESWFKFEIDRVVGKIESIRFVDEDAAQDICSNADYWADYLKEELEGMI